MLRGLWLVLILGLAAVSASEMPTSLNTEVANKSVVFFYAADDAGNLLNGKQVGTGFLISVPTKDSNKVYTFLVTARHIMDPVWAGCGRSNPRRLFVRVNKNKFDPEKDATGVTYIAWDVVENGKPVWTANADDHVDVAVSGLPKDLVSGQFDVRFLPFGDFGSSEEIGKLGVGSQIASTGLVPGFEGEKRNYPIFKFGKIASIPEEMPAIRCTPQSAPRSLRIWWLGTNQVQGTSGSPIFFDPMFPPGGVITAGEPRTMIMGLQSVSVPGADLAGMTPAKYIIEVISKLVGDDANLRLGPPAAK